MRVIISQFEGVDVTSALPLAAGCLIAAARVDPALAGASFDLTWERQPIAAAVAAYDAPDVLGFSLYPWNARYALAVAAEARRAYPDALIVAGGSSVPRRPDAARRFLDEHPAVDVLVFAEGELTFRALLAAHRRQRGLDDVAGLAYRRPGGDHVVTAPPVRVRDFTELPSPYLDGTFEALLARHPGRFAMALLETNRGCPFSCTFCDWSLTKAIHERPLARVHAELDWVTAHGFSHIGLADANFGIRPRDADLARYIADLRRRTGRPATCYFYLTKNDHRRNLETIEILQGAGVGCWVSLAVQDFDDGVLEAVRRDNIQTGESLALRRIMGERGVPTHNELILGLPGQTYDSFTATVVAAMPAFPQHEFVVFLCRLIENTELAAPETRARFGIETRRSLWRTGSPGWDPIVDEYQELVVATHDLPVADWRRTFGFVAVAGAAYNLRLLRVVLAYLGDEVGADLRGYVAYLCARAADAAAGTVFAELGAIVARYADSVLAGGGFVLPVDGHAAACEAPDALAFAALARLDDFYAEARVHTAAFVAAAGVAAPALAAAFRFQALITPRWGDAAATTAGFAHDWPAYVAAGGTGAALPPRAVTLRFTPPVYVTVPTAASFAETQLACVRARLPTGELEVVAPGPAPRRLPVLGGPIDRPG